MLIPLILGFLIGKSYGKEKTWMMISFLFGIIIGIIGGLELIPLVYPLYAARPPDWVGLPEYRPIAIYLVGPTIKIYQEVVLMTYTSLFVISILSIVSIVGVMIGQVIGARKMKRGDIWLAHDQ
jgi:hypothetical protein